MSDDLLVYNIDEPQRLTPPEKWIHTAVVYVSAHGTFPLDMLRYDSCWPATSEDAAKIGKATGPENDKPLAIRVKKCGGCKRSPWTTRRWESFGVRLQAAGEAPPWDVQKLAAAASA